MTTIAWYQTDNPYNAPAVDSYQSFVPAVDATGVIDSMYIAGIEAGFVGEPTSVGNVTFEPFWDAVDDSPSPVAMLTSYDKLEWSDDAMDFVATSTHPYINIACEARFGIYRLRVRIDGVLAAGQLTLTLADAGSGYANVAWDWGPGGDGGGDGGGGGGCNGGVCVCVVVNPRDLLMQAAPSRLHPVFIQPNVIIPELLPSLEVPPTPTGFAVSAAISNIIIQHDAPLFSGGHGYARTHVYGALWYGGALPVFADAVRITSFAGSISTYATNPAQVWHLWITWESKDGVESLPAGGHNGLIATTGQDVERLLKALNGKITESQLYDSLGRRIDLIDGIGPGSVGARIGHETLERTDGDNQLAAMIDYVEARLDTGDYALVKKQVTSTANSLGSAASDVTDLQARLNTGDYAAVKTQSSSSASAVTGLQAQYTVKVDINGYVAGFGLASNANNSKPFSEFAVRADMFYIASPGGSDIVPKTPFTVVTTPTVINGVDVPAGVYMDGIFVKNGTFSGAQIARLTVDDGAIANLGVNKLTAGAISVSAYIRSYNFVAGQQGFAINGDGSVEFSNALIRGAVNTGDYLGYGWPAAGGRGAHLSASGLLIGNANDGTYFQVTAEGNVYAPGLSIVGGVATFAGALTGASLNGGSINGTTGTFDGQLTARAINAVKTINIAGNAVTTSVNGIGGSLAQAVIYVPPDEYMNITIIGSCSNSSLLELLIDGVVVGTVTPTVNAKYFDIGDSGLYEYSINDGIAMGLEKVYGGAQGRNVLVSATGSNFYAAGQTPITKFTAFGALR